MSSEIVLLALRHDYHKTHGVSHAHHSKNHKEAEVPYGADLAASAMSRPPYPLLQRSFKCVCGGEMKRKNKGNEFKCSGCGKSHMDGLASNDDSHYRISLLTNERLYESGVTDWRTVGKRIDELYAIDDVEVAHNAFLKSSLLGLFNEDYFNPHTSLKYHTLLTTALAYNLSKGVDYDKLWLHISKPGASDYTTIYSDDFLRLDIAGEDLKSLGKTKIPFLTDKKGHRIGAMWFGRSWGKLPTHIGADRNLDSILRRMGSWSIALQMMEDWRASDIGGDGDEN